MQPKTKKELVLLVLDLLQKLKNDHLSNLGAETSNVQNRLEDPEELLVFGGSILVQAQASVDIATKRIKALNTEIEGLLPLLGNIINENSDTVCLCSIITLSFAHEDYFLIPCTSLNGKVLPVMPGIKIINWNGLLAPLVFGKKVGDEFSFNGKNITITKIR